MGGNCHQSDELIPELLGVVRPKSSNILLAEYTYQYIILNGQMTYVKEYIIVYVLCLLFIHAV